MKRILLVLEDYNEQSFIETLFKKIGFDVLSLRNEVMLSDNLLTFKPDVVIGTGDGPKIKGSRISKKVRERGFAAHMILLFPINKINDQKLMEQFKDEVCMETPINPRQLIGTLCDLTKLNAETVFQKYEKLPISKMGGGKNSRDLLTIISGKGGDSRESKYADILNKSPQYEDKGFSKDKVATEVEKIREFEKGHPDLKELDKMRQDFVVALYKKK